MQSAMAISEQRAGALAPPHWPALALIVTYLLLFAAVASGVAGPNLLQSRTVERQQANLVSTLAPPKAEPLKFQPVLPTDAVQINALLPIAKGPNPAAAPFSFAAGSAEDRERSIGCLTAAIYYEAATEPLDGQRAVAQVVLNRVRHPAYPNNVCAVVWQGSERNTGCQFTFTCDGSLARKPMASFWEKARKVAEAALTGYVFAPVGWSTHYHTNWVVPYWSSSLLKAATVGTHIFYRWTGGWGRAPAFTNRYSGRELNVAGLGRHSPLPKPTEDMTPLTPAEALAQLTPEEVAKLDLGVGFENRPIVRRFEPATRQGVESLLQRQLQPGETITPEMRWALTGNDQPLPAAVPVSPPLPVFKPEKLQTLGPASAAPASKTPTVKAGGTAPPVAATAPKPACLDGVKKAGEALNC